MVPGALKGKITMEKLLDEDFAENLIKDDDDNFTCAADFESGEAIMMKHKNKWKEAYVTDVLDTNEIALTFTNSSERIKHLKIKVEGSNLLLLRKGGSDERDEQNEVSEKSQLRFAAAALREEQMAQRSVTTGPIIRMNQSAAFFREQGNCDCGANCAFMYMGRSDMERQKKANLKQEHIAHGGDGKGTKMVLTLAIIDHYASDHGIEV